MPKYGFWFARLPDTAVRDDDGRSYGIADMFRKLPGKLWELYINLFPIRKMCIVGKGWRCGVA